MVRASANPISAGLSAYLLVKLEQFLKWQGLVGTGGEAKQRVQRGDVRVNGSIETRRGRSWQRGMRWRWMASSIWCCLPAAPTARAGKGPLGRNLSL
jgi:hypothetical protein